MPDKNAKPRGAKATFLVTVDLDPTQGAMQTSADAKEHVEDVLRGAISHCHPDVTLHTETKGLSAKEIKELITEKLLCVKRINSLQQTLAGSLPAHAQGELSGQLNRFKLRLRNAEERLDGQ